jgi:hypothetical protein
LKTKEVLEAQEMGYSLTREIADEGQIHLRTHLEELKLAFCHKNPRRRGRDVLAPEISFASLRPIVEISNSVDRRG